jgi:ADP-ribose pyrophosphatase YjhB (NUDIX family)
MSPFGGRSEIRPEAASPPQVLDAPGHPGVLGSDESLVEVRCSVVVVREQDVLLLRRLPAAGEPAAASDWVLPGGRPRPGEGMQACAGRELAEETGVRLTPQRCAFLTDVTDPSSGRRRVEIFFVARVHPDFDDPLTGEGAREPVWVPVTEIRHLRLRPPVAGYLPALVGDRVPTIPYLGNLWRPDEEPA